MSKLEVKRVIIFKHGVSYFILEGTQKGIGTFELEFKIDEMNDVLKSLFVLDTSEKGYISSISYDAALDTYQLLRSVMLDIPDTDSFSSLITQIKGAQVNLTIGTSEKLTGTIMGIEYIEKLNKEGKVTEKLLPLLKEDGIITKIPFSEISSLEIVNEDLKKDLKFFLDTVIAGKKKDAKKISINCESGGDDSVDRKIIVSYIRESPVWKTSYRLIMTRAQAEEEKCLLSGWCMVENTTNQDWEEISLSLVAGMPVSFIYDFYRPIFIDRPRIQPPRVLSARPTDIEEGLEMDKFDDYRDRKKEKSSRRAPAKPMASPAVMAPPPMPGGGAGMFGGMTMADSTSEVSVMEKLKSQTSVQTKDMGELFEYNISNLVSIKRKHSALVPILTEEIKARRILLYNPNEMGKNPNACLEITNNTPLTLERGPVTIIYDENLAGEAIIPFLNKEDTRLLNYAVEQAVIITREQKTEHLKVHRVTASGNYVYEYYNTNMSSFYKIKNKTNEEKTLYLDHPKTGGYKITDSPVEPEETPNYWRFKITLKPKDAIKFDLKEQYENYSSYYLWNWNKDDFFKKISFYISKKFIDEKLEGQLKEIANLIGEANDLNEKKEKMDIERDQMTDEQARIRENISVLGTSSQESALREKYVKKFSIQEERFEKITADIKELEKKIKELNKDIEEKMNKLKYD
jgi:hypothetical protein